MKSKRFRIAVLSLLLALVAAVALLDWPRYLKHAEDSTLQSVGRHSKEISAVEVLRLSDSGRTGPAGSYLVRYDNSRRGIAARQTLSGPQASDLVRIWGEVRFAESYTAGCHEPGFILRFLAGKRCIFEVAVCFHCENVSWKSAPFITSLRQMVPTALDRKSGFDNLKALLTQLP